MEIAKAEGSLTRQLRRRHIKTTKALKNDSYKSNIEDTVHIAVITPNTPQLKYMGKKLHSKKQIGSLKNCIIATIANQLITEGRNTTTNI